MSSNKSPADVASELRTSLAARGRDSRCMRSLTFWRMFGVARRTPASIERVIDALSAEGLVARVTSDALGTESRVDWVTVSLVEHAATTAPTNVPFADLRAAQPAVLPTVPSAPAENPNLTAARMRAGPPPTGGYSPAPPFLRGGFSGVRAFATRHPIASAIILLSMCGLASSGRFQVLVTIGALWWFLRMQMRTSPWLASLMPRLDLALNWADSHRGGVALASAMAAAIILGMRGLMSGVSPATVQPAVIPPIAAPTERMTGEEATRVRGTMVPARDELPAKSASPTATRTTSPTDTPRTPTITPTHAPPTETPPIDIDPGRFQRCDSFPNYDTMKAWRDYWQARGVANPGRLDGDGDGLACEAGEGGRPDPTRRPATPIPAPVPLYQAPAPAPPSSGGGGGGCCKYCNPARSKPCGDSCISLSKNCHKGAGCACSGGG